jgi:hypothetical protein
MPVFEKKIKMNIKKAFEVLKKAMEEDEDYAWSWHCNIAMAAYDEGLSHKKANKAANRFMKLCFGIDTKEPKSNNCDEVE